MTTGMLKGILSREKKGDWADVLVFLMKEFGIESVRGAEFEGEIWNEKERWKIKLKRKPEKMSTLLTLAKSFNEQAKKEQKEQERMSRKK